jgi:phosphoglycolate phosphatase
MTETLWPKAVVFDLDGTLIESLPDIQLATNRTLEDFGLAPLDDKTTRGFVGKGSRHLLTQALLHYGKVPEDEEIDYAYLRFLHHYGLAPNEAGYVFPGVTGTLRALTDAGHELAVCTNKPHAPTIQVMEAYGIGHFFDVIVGGDDVENRKPHPDHLLETTRRLNMDKADVVFVGDSENDIQASVAADIRSVLLTYGYSSLPHDSLGADVIVDTFPEVIGAIDTIVQARS